MRKNSLSFAKRNSVKITAKITARTFFSKLSVRPRGIMISAHQRGRAAVESIIRVFTKGPYPPLTARANTEYRVQFSGAILK